jgi:intracellular multiplication protein IcmO
MATNKGIDFRLEREQQSLIIDTRRLGDRLRDLLSDDVIPAGIMLVITATLIVLHPLTELVFLVGLAFFAYARHVQKTAGLALRMPKSSGLIDPKETSLKKDKVESPITGKSHKIKKGGATLSEGIVFMGNDRDTGEEVWLTDVMARTHMLYMGTTGSGKTEALVSLVYNSLIHGSGFIYVDGKADSSLYGKIYSMARAMGRDDDVLVINFQTGAKDIYGPQPTKLSNTLNPFAVGSAGMLSELVKGLMASGEKSTWTQQAESFVEGLMKPLVYLRDKHGLLLDISTVRTYFELDKLEDLAWRDGDKYPGLVESGVLEGIQNYLLNKPAYKKEKYHEQSETTLEQHGYITMQLIRTFNSLSDTYGYIMRTPLAEIDFVDVFLNRRILVVLLPALEKSPTELTNLGRIVVASIKATMAKGLGSQLEGEWAKIIDSKPTSAPSPFMCVLDEYGYYAVEGFAVVPAQARSLGFSAIFAGQDLPAFQKASKEEAASTLANTNTRLCGKLECTETYRFFNDIAKEGLFTKVQGYENKAGDITATPFRANDGISIDRVARVSFEVLRAQNSGDWHLFFANTILRVASFFANPKKVKHLRVNHFVRVARPNPSEVEAFKNTRHLFARAVGAEGGLKSYMDRVSSPSDILDIHAGLEMFESDVPFIRAAKALAYCAQAERRRGAEFEAMTAAGFAEAATLHPTSLDIMGRVSGGFEDDMPFIESAPESSWTARTATPASNQVSGWSRSDTARTIASAEDAAFGFDDGAPEVRGYGRPAAFPYRQPEDAQQAAPLPDEITDPDDPLYGIPDDVQEAALASAEEDHAGYGDGYGYTDEFGRDPVEAARSTLLPASHEQTNIFAQEWSDVPDAIANARNDVEPDAMDLAHDAAASDVFDDAGDFDPPMAEQGLLDRDATISGLAAIERATGAPEIESQMTAAAVAETLASSTSYPLTPPSQKPDMARFENLAQRLSHQLTLSAEDDD